ncbi:MAG: trypsin-like serine protease [Myxococcales bacterium]|nr:trypsin-like serine protease [Myxococcales bacterium]
MSRVKNLCFGLGLSLISFGAACVDQAQEIDVSVESDEIVGGANTTIAAHPWQVAITTNSGFQFCGGSIVNASWIVTAQHCVAGGNSDMRVVAGITRISQQATGQIRAVNAVTTAPGFTDPTVGDDVALLHLSTPLDLSGANAKAIGLVSPADATAGATNPGVVSNVSGWGTLSSGGGTPDTLQAVDVPLLSNATVSSLYGMTITGDQLGAGVLNVGGKDSCQGDSGGPLTVLFGGAARLAGVVSWGNGCAEAQFPGLYARVSSFHAYITGRTGGTFSTPIALTGLSGARNSFTHRSITVPAGTLALSVIVRGGTGDADLYVRRGSQPTTSAFDCRPFLDGNSEFCSIDLPVAGTYFISMRAFAAFSGASLTAALIR